MNIWALDKDLSIKHLLLMLSQQVDPGRFVIGDAADLNAMAIRLYKPGEDGISAYLYTYGQGPERYGVHLEYPASGSRELNDNQEVKENLTFEQLLEILSVHLELIVGD